MQEFEEKRASKQLLQNRLDKAKKGQSSEPPLDRTPYRNPAQRRMEGGQRYLIHWIGTSVTEASWESAKRLNNPQLVHDFEQAVKRAVDLRGAASEPGAERLRQPRDPRLQQCARLQGPASRNPTAQRKPLGHANVPGGDPLQRSGAPKPPRNRNRPVPTPQHYQQAAPSAPAPDPYLDRRGLINSLGDD